MEPQNLSVELAGLKLELAEHEQDTVNPPSGRFSVDHLCGHVGSEQGTKFLKTVPALKIVPSSSASPIQKKAGYEMSCSVRSEKHESMKPAVLVSFFPSVTMKCPYFLTSDMSLGEVSIIDVCAPDAPPADGPG